MKDEMTQLHVNRFDVLDRTFGTNTDLVRCCGIKMCEVQSATLDATLLNGILRLEPSSVAASGVGATNPEQQFRPL